MEKTLNRKHYTIMAVQRPLIFGQSFDSFFHCRNSAPRLTTESCYVKLPNTYTQPFAEQWSDRFLRAIHSAKSDPIPLNEEVSINELQAASHRLYRLTFHFIFGEREPNCGLMCHRRDESRPWIYWLLLFFIINYIVFAFRL